MTRNGNEPRRAHPDSERLGSPSIASVSPRAWRYAARCTAVVDLATPPLNEATVIIIEHSPILRCQRFEVLGHSQFGYAKWHRDTARMVHAGANEGKVKALRSAGRTIYMKMPARNYPSCASGARRSRMASSERL